MEKPEEKAALPEGIAKMSFEEALDELEKLVRRLEDGKARLDDAISAYERGALLKKHCENKLREAQARIEQISVASDSPEGLSKAPFKT